MKYMKNHFAGILSVILAVVSFRAAVCLSYLQTQQKNRKERNDCKT